jgi:hypothetical protein
LVLEILELELDGAKVKLKVGWGLGIIPSPPQFHHPTNMPSPENTS